MWGNKNMALPGTSRIDYEGRLHSQEFMWSGAIAKCRKQANDGSDVVAFSKSPTLLFTTARES